MGCVLPRRIVYRLIDYLIRPQKQRRRNREAKGLRGLQVDHQIELRWSFDGQIRGLDTLEDLVYLDR